MSVWLHSTKGLIVGEVVGTRGEWTKVRLSEDAWADVRHRRRDPAGTIQTYRTSRLMEMEARPEPGGSGS